MEGPLFVTDGLLGERVEAKSKGGKMVAGTVVAIYIPNTGNYSQKMHLIMRTDSGWLWDLDASSYRMTEEG